MTAFAPDVRPASLFRSISLGMEVGLIALVNTITYGVLIYKPTGDTLSGVMLALINGLVLSLLFGYFGALPGMTAFPQSAMTPVFASLTAGITLALRGQPPSVVVSTVTAAVLLASLLVGLAYLLLGYRRLGELIRFLPYPVSAGFLAGLGWLLFKSGFEMGLGRFMLTMLFDPALLLRWLPAFLLGMVLFVLQQKSSLTWLTPVVIVGAVVGFYLWHLPRESIEDLRRMGWLLVIAAPTPTQTLFFSSFWVSMGQIRWDVIWQNGGIFLTVLFTALISLLLNLNAIEMGIRRDVDPNREMRLAGWGNLLTLAAGGGIVGYPSAGLTLLANRNGPPGRVFPFVVSGFFVVTLLLGTQYLSYLPNFVIGGLLIALGANFLQEWLLEGAFKFSRTDFLVVLAMFLTVVFTDLLRGVGLGMALMVVLFAVSYSRTNVIRHVLTGKTYQSSVDRPLKHARYLHEQGAQLLILRLQGYIFFGTAYSIYDWVKAHLPQQYAEARYLVLDFGQVYGLDSSAANVFTRLCRFTEARRMTLVFTALSESYRRTLTRAGFDLDHRNVRVFETLDYAAEWCEAAILSLSSLTMITSRALVQNLGAFFTPEELKALFRYMQRLELPEQSRLIVQGEEPPGLYFIERGQVTVYRERQDGTQLRLRVVGPGVSVGEISLYGGGPASASVQTDSHVEMYLLTRQQLAEMEARDAALAVKFHRYIVELLGQRLQQTVASVQALVE